MRIRIAVVVALASLMFALAGVSSAGAATHRVTARTGTGAAPLYTLNVSGVAKNGKKFAGRYGINRFAVATVGGKRGVYAIGTLTGTLKGRHVVRNNVMIPASLTGASSGVLGAAAVSCPVLHLVLGPVNLNLLGLKVTLGGGTLANQPIVVDITAVPGAGNLLGNLLCGVTNLLNQQGALSGLTGQLQQLAATLNSLVSLLGAL